MLTDDVGFNDFHDSSDIGEAWNNTRALLSEAIQINSTYTETISIPSRRSFLTGRQARLVTPEREGQDWSKNETTIAHKLLAQGYVTYAIGKWFAGYTSWTIAPTGRGFARFFGQYENIYSYNSPCAKAAENDPLDAPRWDTFYSEAMPFETRDASFEAPFLRYGLEAIGPDGNGRYKTELYDDKAITFIEQHKLYHPDKPLFLYYAPVPIRGAGGDKSDHPDEYMDAPACAGLDNERRRKACAAAVALDESVGHLASALNTGAYANDDHVVAMTADNGAATWRVSSGGSNAPLRGNKYEVFEGGVRLKALVWGRHPGLASSPLLGQTYTGGRVQLTDWHATFAALGGHVDISTEQEEVNTGLDVWAAITSNSASPRTEMIVAKDFYTRQAGVAFWQGQWKLMVGVAYGPDPDLTCVGGAYGPTCEVPGDSVLQHLGHSFSARSGDNVAYLEAHRRLFD